MCTELFTSPNTHLPTSMIRKLFDIAPIPKISPPIKDIAIDKHNPNLIPNLSINNPPKIGKKQFGISYTKNIFSNVFLSIPNPS